jgi:short-subunit dehydrogenase
MIGLNKTALVTGATSGIGLELTKLFAADGYNLVLVARDEQRLRQIVAVLPKKHSLTKVIATDLSMPATLRRFIGNFRMRYYSRSSRQ